MKNFLKLMLSFTDMKSEENILEAKKCPLKKLFIKIGVTSLLDNHNENIHQL